MWISIVFGVVIAIFAGWMIEDVSYWKDYPMDHSNLIPLGILIAALLMLILSLLL